VDRLAERRKAAGVAPSVLASNKQFQEELTIRLAAAGMKLPMKRANPRKDGSTPMIPALAKSDPGFMKLLESGVTPVVDLIRGRLVERSATNALDRINKLAAFNAMGGVRTHLVYYGAHTGRWAAAGGFNLQNLTSPDRATDPVDREIAASIREAIIPGVDADGDDLLFVSADAAQIEARVIAWLAGQADILEAFSNGQDIYSLFISDVTGKEVRKPTIADDPERAAWFKLWRHVGKESILGLGFSMGAATFQARLEKASPELRKLVEDGTLDLDECQRIVDVYRNKYPEIPELWRKLNHAFMGAKDGRSLYAGPYIRFRKAGKLTVAADLPSGRSLYYRNIRREKYTGANKGNRKSDYEWKHGNGQRIYGGLLAENVTQAVARDAIAETLYKAETEKGYPVVLHVHDELVLRVPSGEAEAAKDWLIKSLSTPPEWALGLPLGAEGSVKKNLGK
jgi:DNA polymerase